jgi:hypothetical protein
LKLFDDTASGSVIPSSDSTLGVALESMERMQRAVLYARVSSDAQQKEGTIESQVVDLKRQIAAANTAIERTGAPTALIVTRGTRDVYQIARGNRPES